jgi:hypothetical protein
MRLHQQATVTAKRTVISGAQRSAMAARVKELLQLDKCNKSHIFDTIEDTVVHLVC